MSFTKHQLADLVLAASALAEREAIAAFIRDAATVQASNPFRTTSAGAARQLWSGQAFEFRVFGTHAAGLTDLLTAVAALPAAEALTQEILRAGPHTCCVLLGEGGSRVVGAVLHGKPGVTLPDFAPVPAPSPGPARRRRAAPTVQLDLFADGP
ncbi:hypothetical protein [Methylobacterium sp. Leaf118]|uniref:hypothetical protein n=1 Tax=Methylobacterium sp. Leaf118 TaxID=2876562 RepID=UPI001E50E516|nr:hypothetical protein [Methylobacterium sp. Leaf118]